jgi:ribosomal protein S18 acetylase RimI-like enzyme
MEIKKVTKDDLGIINDLLANHIDASDFPGRLPTITHLETLLTDDRCYLLAAIIDTKVVGYSLAYRFPSLYAVGNMAYLYDIDVVPEHRREGIGRLLVETMISLLKADDVIELWLGTGVENLPAQRLFAATRAIRSGESFFDYTYSLVESGK